MKKRILAVMLISLMVTGLIACSSKESKETSSDTGSGKSEKQETVDVTLNEVAHSIFYAPMYVAIEEGYFADEGINLDLVTGFGTLHLVQNAVPLSLAVSSNYHSPGFFSFFVDFFQYISFIFHFFPFAFFSLTIPFDLMVKYIHKRR